ncbi:MAG: MFS transporter [Oscillospiraceae bacterium]|jgi:DHA3 family macrolide efflux protein-like MFS transporter|nr:MFS transporter [Oscillospiraceae bacterium]
MNKFLSAFAGLRMFFIVWSTQNLSILGSSMTSFALVIWSYQQKGSALTTALLSVCSYAPYVALSIFAGSLGDRWDKRRTMIACDSFAALTTLAVLALLRTGRLEIWHLYVLNALSGLMNTIQNPVSEVLVTLLSPKEQVQRVSGLLSLSGSLVSLLSPVFAAAVLALLGLEAVIAFDLLTCAVAVGTMAFAVRIPEAAAPAARPSLTSSAREGLGWLAANRGVLDLILFLACINLIASMYNAALPAMLLSRPGGGETVLGLVEAVTGLASLAGSLLASALPEPRSRVRVICNSLLVSMSTENLLLALGRGPVVWCCGAVLGWLLIPVMNTNMNALLRLRIPVEMQGRVYAARNTLQFFTIPVGYLLGGALVDRFFEPLMASLPEGALLRTLLGSGKGTGAAALFLVIAGAGVLVCLAFRRDRRLWELEE